MATSSSTSNISSLLLSNQSCNLRPLQDQGRCSYRSRRSDFHRFASRTPPNMDMFVRRATPEAADLLSSFSLPNIPGLSLPGDSPWLAGVAGLLVTVPLMLQRLLTLTKEMDMAAQTVEKIADAVEKVAEEVDKAAEEIGEALPEGGLKRAVNLIEDLAEETAKDAQKVEDLMDKVEELDDKLEAFLDKQFKGTGKA